MPEGDEKELQKQIEKVVDDWAGKHKSHPTFYRVINVAEIKIKVTSETCWEVSDDE